MSTTTITKKWYIDGNLTDPTGIVMSDPDGGYGVRRKDNEAEVVADGTSMDKISTGVYQITFTDPAYDLTYEYWVEVDYLDDIYRFEGEVVGTETPVSVEEEVELKASKRRMYCTFWDVISESESIITDKIDVSGHDITTVVALVKRIGQIEAKIYSADGIINTSLAAIYSNFDTTSWSTPPVPDRDNETKSARLNSVYINNSDDIDPYSATWIAEITTTASEFSLESSLEGSQGTGLDITSTIVSSNGDVTILAAAWDNVASLADGDKFYFSVVDVHPIIHRISVMLSTSMVLKSIFTGESPNESAAALGLWDDAMALLGKLQRPFEKDGLQLSAYSKPSTESYPVRYVITDDGQDISPYLETDTTLYE